MKQIRMGVSAVALATAATIMAAAPVFSAQAASAPTEEYQRKAPANAPNIVLVLLDDVGFGAAGTFGGPVATPALNELAQDGLRYNRFHTTGICSPTRASLLTGRNPHLTGIGSVMNSADSRPGYSGFQRKDTATIAEVLRQNGYSTAAFGKWHQTPDWELSPSGPFDRWPTGQGFEKFYGFHGGETDQFEPSLFDGTTPVLRRPGENYHLTEDLAERSIAWMRTIKSVTPDKPFFLYFSTGGIHAPIQVPDSWKDRYRGKFDQGWDKLREEIFERQKKLGVIPADAKLTPRPKELPAWDSLTPEQQKFSSRLMEVYAAFLEHTDAQVGRLVQELKDSGQFDNTIFIYIVGDNGASGEGGLGGSLNYMGSLVGLPEPEEAKLAGVERFGGPDSYGHISTAWAWATNTPFQWTKTIASHLGATRNPLVITWPERIRDKGGLRSQFGHVNDIVPTLLEAIGIEMPEKVNGVPQKPISGTSLAYTFDQPDAPERHRTQYFEVFGHRSIYHEGWMASAFHARYPWQAFAMGNKRLEDDTWELYDLRSDFSQANDLASKYPERLAELQAVFLKEAEANQLLPLAGQNLDKSALPDLSRGVTRATYREGAVGIPETAIPKIFNRSWSLLARVEVKGEAEGVIATLGGASAGWSLFLNSDRRPVFSYRAFEAPKVNLVGTQPLPAGEHNLRVDFDYASSGGYGKGGKLRLMVNGEAVATGETPFSPPAMFSINETFDVGIDTGSAGGRYPANAELGFPLKNAKIGEVTIELR